MWLVYVVKPIQMFVSVSVCQLLLCFVCVLSIIGGNHASYLIHNVSCSDHIRFGYYLCSLLCIGRYNMKLQTTDEERIKKILNNAKDRAEQKANEEYKKEYLRMWNREHPSID